MKILDSYIVLLKNLFFDMIFFVPDYQVFQEHNYIQLNKMYLFLQKLDYSLPLLIHHMNDHLFHLFQFEDIQII